MIVRNTKTPTTEAGDLVAAAKDLKKEADMISGDLTEEGAKNMQSFRGPDGETPGITEAKGSVKFWVKDVL